MAGIAAGYDGTASGVAPGAGIVAVQVFSRFTTEGRSDDVRTWPSDHILGLEHVYDLVVNEGRPIASVNMSFGGGVYTEVCDEYAVKAAVDNLLAVGVATTIPTGNGGSQNGTAYPGCTSSAITVGGTTKADAVMGVSNVAPWMDVFAPGSSIRTSTVGGGFGSASGTSMAAPHVAGAWAVLRQRYPAESVAEILARLQAAGVGIAAGAPEALYPRIQIDAALGDGPTLVYEPGAISFTLDGGDAASEVVVVANGADAGSRDLVWAATVEGAPWASISPASGRVAPGGSATFSLDVDASGLAGGTYAADLVLTTTAQADPSVTIPITLVVGGGSGSGVVSGGPGWYLLGSPTPNTTVDQLAAMNLVAGVPGYYPTFYQGPPATPTLYTAYGATGWTASSGAGEVLASGQGFLWYFWDEAFTPEEPTTYESSAVVLPATLHAPGAINTSDAVRVLHTGGDRFNAMGNPFALPLDLTDIEHWPGGDAVASKGRAFVWDPVLDTWVYGAAAATVQPWEGFVVRATSSGGTLTIPASAALPAGKAAPAPQPRRVLAFELEGREMGTHRAIMDRALEVSFDDGASGGWDDLDAEKLAPLAEAFVRLGVLAEQRRRGGAEGGGEPASGAVVVRGAAGAGDGGGVGGADAAVASDGGPAVVVAHNAARRGDGRGRWTCARGRRTRSRRRRRARKGRVSRPSIRAADGLWRGGAVRALGGDGDGARGRGRGGGARALPVVPNPVREEARISVRAGRLWRGLGALSTTCRAARSRGWRRGRGRRGPHVLRWDDQRPRSRALRRSARRGRSGADTAGRRGPLTPICILAQRRLWREAWLYLGRTGKRLVS